jgi:L-lactate dehydrogenase complex protein LldF
VKPQATNLQDRARVAVANQKLRAALWSVTGRILANREQALAELDDAAGKRDLARHARMRGLQELDVHLERFADNCERNGIQLHWAADAAQANEIICELAAGCEGGIIKSKSMATEETGLNEALEARGWKVTETDLGEWIVQLAREHPSHIIAPALHRSKEQCAEVISEHIGQPVAADPPLIVKAARDRLREEFIAASVGISGVNLGIAETGTLVLVTNEGNGRLVTSGPRIHIALMGIEKIVPTLDDAIGVLRVLARSATGQKMTSYTSFISGPRRPDEPDGPNEVHVVLLDNGRSDYLGNELWESLLCIRCGACLNTCPVYRRIGGHAYGSPYSGPVGLLVTPMIRPSDPEAHVALPHASSLCGACHDICPVLIDIPRMILALRARSVRAQGPGWVERSVFRVAGWVLRRPRAYAVLRWLVGWLLAPFRGRVPGAAAWTASRRLPPVARIPFHTWWRRRQLESAHARDPR